MLNSNLYLIHSSKSNWDSCMSVRSRDAPSAPIKSSHTQTSREGRKALEHPGVRMPPRILFKSDLPDLTMCREYIRQTSLVSPFKSAHISGWVPTKTTRTSARFNKQQTGDSSQMHPGQPIISQIGIYQPDIYFSSHARKLAYSIGLEGSSCISIAPSPGDRSCKVHR